MIKGQETIYTETYIVGLPKDKDLVEVSNNFTNDLAEAICNGSYYLDQTIDDEDVVRSKIKPKIKKRIDYQFTKQTDNIIYNMCWFNLNTDVHNKEEYIQTWDSIKEWTPSYGIITSSMDSLNKDLKILEETYNFIKSETNACLVVDDGNYYASQLKTLQEENEEIYINAKNRLEKIIKAKETMNVIMLTFAHKGIVSSWKHSPYDMEFFVDDSNIFVCGSIAYNMEKFIKKYFELVY